MKVNPMVKGNPMQYQTISKDFKKGKRIQKEIDIDG